ncbi:hypothetical protein ACE6H2_026094 [Prunus campanulata]
MQCSMCCTSVVLKKGFWAGRGRGGELRLIIKHRLLTRTTTTRGEPPLKKRQKKFTSLIVKLDKNEDNYGDCDKLAKAFFQQLSLKSKAVVDANLRETHNFDELREEISRQIVQARTDIELVKKQLEESKIERRHKEECDLEKEIAALDDESTASSRMLELRKKQFALLLHVVCSSVKFPDFRLCCLR